MGVRVRGPVAKDSLARIADSLQTMDLVLDELQREVATLQSRWNGDARDAFSTAMFDAHASVRRLRSIASAATTEASTVVGQLDDFDRRRQSAWPV